jgi:hypothetical protein
MIEETMLGPDSPQSGLRFKIAGGVLHHPRSAA